MPNTITDTITELADNKSDIQDALVAKGVTLAAGHGFNKFAADIATITNQYTQTDEGKVVSGGELVAQTSTTATVNGTINTTTNNEVVVNVPNTYTAGDEGKVVNSGALVSQTAYPSTITENGTYNTTENNSVTVNVPISDYIIIPCNYSADISDTSYTKGPTQLIIDTVNKTVELIVNFNRKTSFAQVYTSYIVLTPTIQLSEIFDSQTVFTMNYQALGTKQSTSGGGTYDNSVYPSYTNPFFTIDITNNTISIRSGMYIYGGLTACIKWTYQ